MSDYEQEAPIDDETKAEIAAEFLKYAPPGEFNEERFNTFFLQTWFFKIFTVMNLASYRG